MGDCDFLYGMKSDKPQGSRKKDEGVIMAAETDNQMRIPLLWGALFTAKDRRTIRWNVRGKQHSLSAWHTSLASALENLRARIPAILPRVHPALHPFVEAFEQALAACTFPYLQLDMEALAFWLDHDRKAVDERVEACLGAWQSEDAWRAYFGGPQITNTYDLYGMKFLFSNWSPKSGQVGWYAVGDDGKIRPSGCPGGVFVVGKDTSSKEKPPDLPLFFIVCAKGDLPAVRSLLKSGQDVNTRVELPQTKGVTGLMLASLYGQAPVVEELIRAGADVNAMTDKQAFALALAAEDGHTEVVRLLIAAGADVNAKNEDGWDAMMMAVIYKHSAIQDLLLDAGADKGDTESSKVGKGDPDDSASGG